MKDTLKLISAGAIGGLIGSLGVNGFNMQREVQREQRIIAVEQRLLKDEEFTRQMSAVVVFDHDWIKPQAEAQKFRDCVKADATANLGTGFENHIENCKA